MIKIEVVYSPICEASASFMGILQEWLEGKNVEIISSIFDCSSEYQKKLYESNGLAVNGRMLETCFIDVFYKDRLIDSVPLSKRRIFLALGITDDNYIEDRFTIVPDNLSVDEFRKLVRNEEISWIPITKDTFMEEMDMCLHNYPLGNPPERFHSQCIKLKKHVFDQVWKEEVYAGIYAKYKDIVIGIIEVFPREIMKKYGFLTGSTGNDRDYLTVGCYEVGFGIPRKEMIDELMLHLELNQTCFSRKWLEGIGVYEWPDGFTPYWVFDKYGFKKKEIISEYKVVMEKSLS